MDRQLVEVVCPVDGTVVRVERGAGNPVGPYSPVVTIESGEMTVAVEAGIVGVVDEVRARIGAVVEPGEVLAVVSADPDAVVVDRSDSVVEEFPAHDLVCGNCGTGGLEPGFVPDGGQGAAGISRWTEGHPEFGWLGGVRLLGRRQRTIEAYRCPRCGLLEFYATTQG